MKLIFTKSITLFTLLFFSFFVHLNAQELHEVNVFNNAFDPSSLSITAGDTVRWTNTQGNHNVNGTASDYPNNPESFGNDVGAGWTYEFVFNMTGNYEYHCDPHVSLGMTGDITVNGGVSVFDLDLSNQIVENVYPQPAQDQVYLDLNIESLSSGAELFVQVYDINGALVMSMETLVTDRIQINTAAFVSGTYIYNILDGKEIVGTGKLLKL